MTQKYLKWNVSATTDRIFLKFENFAEGNKSKLKIPCNEDKLEILKVEYLSKHLLVFLSS
jgi:hypothetical protein